MYARHKGGRHNEGGRGLRYYTKPYEPGEKDPEELGFNTAKKIQLEEVLTEAIGAPVAGTHAAETAVAAERHTQKCL